ncbi:MAG: hypothetical protein HYV67_03095 [Candidatus Taylorbacteria bacterium]|nr:hypothetical protein [Candidatus Taylorbacteria bacterium]
MLQTQPTEAEKLLQLATMVLTDTIHRAPAAYLFGQTADNKHSVLERGAELLRDNVVSRLLLHDAQGEKNKGYEGIGVWKKHLSEGGVRASQITGIPCLELGHTFSEAKALAKYAHDQGWGKLIIVAAPFHQLRAFISMVTAIRLLQNTTLRVYNQVGSTLPWDQKVLHSQGILMATRQDLIVEELRRIKRYQRQSKLMRLGADGLMFLKTALRNGTLLESLRKIPHYAKQCSSVHLLATDEVLKYLEWRDGA